MLNHRRPLPPGLILLFSLLVLALSACAPDDRPEAAANRPGEEAGAKPPASQEDKDKNKAGDRIILFAPVALGKLNEIYPDAALDYARKAALYTSVLASNATGQADSHLPDGASPEWKQGLVTSAHGAHLVVLTSILDLHRTPGVQDFRGNNDKVVALVEMRGLDRKGVTVFSKKAYGEANAVSSPKFSGDVNAPESLASWQAISSCLGSLRGFLRDQQDLPANLDIEVIIESTPPGADVLVDGSFIGNTPLTIKLPPRQLTLALEKGGCKAWSRQLTPITGMHIQPMLEPSGNAAPPPPPSRPPPAH